ncbi:HDOD domain-containing protein [Pseudomonas lalucatii]|uniref:HDOD domain-containing protein n=1 Tax=Pseudomonas lalucatii TaxID=1424203 RepID=A0ABS5Q2V3_9PSED|nr:HDOD domain-containing protein [Pseudomonas lalucatii]MBS7662833.1 HDOD domain-containing protein [Pseudomonas lalucatii]QVM88711.1 HDOD domain-containing protein [Pseudomonas lalucatii]
MRVMILEDDPWIADLLKQIVLSLRPHAQVKCLGSVAEALLDWQQHAADLVISDWNLPDDQGSHLLERVRRDNAQVPLLMVTGRADRDSVLAMRRLGISAFISKPFQLPRVLECLEKLLPTAEAEAASAAVSAASFLEHLAALPAGALDLPLQAGMLDGLQADAAEQPSLQQLNERWQHDAALTARLVAAANSREYNHSDRPCLSLAEALQILGPITSRNIGLGLGLRPAAELEDGELKLQALAYIEQVERLGERVTELAAQARLDPAPLQCAAVLHRIGELCVLHQAQLWKTAGQPLEPEQLQQALAQWSNELAFRLKAHWRLPTPLRELIGACYGLASNNVKRETIVMRLAVCEQHPEPDSDDLARLRRLAGLN